MAIEFPITVTGVEQREWLEPWEPGMRGSDVGKFAMIRPCNKELNPDGKTFLGLYLGDMRVMGGRTAIQQGDAADSVFRAVWESGDLRV